MHGFFKSVSTFAPALLHIFPLFQSFPEHFPPHAKPSNSLLRPPKARFLNQLFSPVAGRAAAQGSREPKRQFMSDSIPSSCCPKRLFSLLFASLFFLSSTPIFGNNGPNVPPAVNERLMQLREYIAGYAQNFTGIEYVRGGHTTRQGFDCSGFTSFALAEFGVNVSPSSLAQAQEGEAVSLDAVLPGDLIFFKRHGRVAHVAMVVRRTETGGIICVHSTLSRGIIVEDIMASNYWRPKIAFARDVITRQVLENKDLLPEIATPLLTTSEEWTPECAEEFEQTCQSLVPLASLASFDLREQLRHALGIKRLN